MVLEIFIIARVELTNKRMKLVQLVIICCKTYSLEFITGTTMKSITSLTYTTEYRIISITKRVKNEELVSDTTINNITRLTN